MLVTASPQGGASSGRHDDPRGRRYAGDVPRSRKDRADEAAAFEARQAAREAAAARARQVYAELLARAPESRMEPRLEPVRALCELLGDPQRSYPVIHLTGTNGKTSTARMIERLLREHNLRTGRFTSPHLHVLNERISIDGRPISDEALADTWDEVAPLVAMVDGQLASQGRAGSDLLRGRHRAGVRSLRRHPG